MKNLIKIITDSKEIEEKRRIARQALSCRSMFNRSWLLERDWYPVVDEDDLPCLDEEIEHILKTLNELDIKKFFAVCLDPTKVLPKVISFPCSVSGYMEFMKEYSGVYFLIFDEDLKFALIVTHDTFHIFASSYKTIQRIYKGAAIEVLKGYRDVALNEREPYISDMLRKYDQCKFFFDLAKEQS